MNDPMTLVTRRGSGHHITILHFVKRFVQIHIKINS